MQEADTLAAPPGQHLLDACSTMDGNQDVEVTVNELVQAVNNVLNDGPG